MAAGEAQGETPLILPSVDRNAVAAVVQDWTGIPTGRMLVKPDREGAQARRDRSPSGSSARTTRWR